MNIRSENDLLQGAWDYNTEILAEIYDLYSPVLFAFAYRQMGDALAAEDCVAETFTRFLKALQSKAGPSEHLKAYLYRIAQNWITDRFRREPVFPIELDENLSVQSSDDLNNQMETNLEIDEIRNALLLLTPDQRQVIALRFIEGWDIDQVAAAVQKPAGAVKALQHRATAALRKSLISVEESYEISK